MRNEGGAVKLLGVHIDPAANRGRVNQVGDEAVAAVDEAVIATTNLSGTSQDDIRAKVKASANEISGLVAIGGDGTSQLGVNLAMEYSLPLGLVPAGSMFIVKPFI